MFVESVGYTPVKGASWLEADVLLARTNGVVGDRLWSPVLADRGGVPLRCVKATDLPELAGVRVLPDELPLPGEHEVFDGELHEVDYYDRRHVASIHAGPVAEALSRVAGRELWLARTREVEPFIWSSPVSLLLRSEVEARGLPADVGRYRANLVIDDRDVPMNLRPGTRLQLGDVVLRVERELDRCVVINHNPVTGGKDANLLRRLRHGALLGFGCRVLQEGMLRRGHELNGSSLAA